jgi:hypothetical protein
MIFTFSGEGGGGPGVGGFIGLGSMEVGGKPKRYAPYSRWFDMLMMRQRRRGEIAPWVKLP